MRKSTLVLLLGVLLFALSVNITPATAQVSNAYDVVAAVNAFRTASGFPALQIDGSLMAAAQAHSDYQASIGTVTHTGAGGTRPTDRAIAYGFGGGAKVFVSENIAAGYDMSISSAIYDYWQDDLHLHTMLNPAAVFIGAGVATVGDRVFYTVDTGYYSGAANPNPAPTASDSGTNPDPAGPTAVAYDLFIISTPSADGSILHVVGFGQTLIGIANTYEVELSDLLAINGLNMDTVIYPGDKIMIKAATEVSVVSVVDFPTETSTPTADGAGSEITVTPQPTLTPRPSRTPTVTRKTTLPMTPVPLSPERSQLVVGVVGVSLVILLVVIVVGFVKRE